MIFISSFHLPSIHHEYLILLSSPETTSSSAHTHPSSTLVPRPFQRKSSSCFMPKTNVDIRLVLVVHVHQSLKTCFHSHPPFFITFILIFSCLSFSLPPFSPLSLPKCPVMGAEILCWYIFKNLKDEANGSQKDSSLILNQDSSTPVQKEILSLSSPSSLQQHPMSPFRSTLRNGSFLFSRLRKQRFRPKLREPG